MAIKSFKGIFGGEPAEEKVNEGVYEEEGENEETYEEEEEKSSENLEIRVVRPKKFEEATQIANCLLNGCLVFLNFESTDKTTSRRIIDYLCGVTYVLRGEFKPVSTTAYILSPNGVDISGAITGSESAPKTEKTQSSEGFGDL